MDIEKRENKMTKDQSLNEESHSLGKGEVDSSILSGSTRKARKTRLFNPRKSARSAVDGRTEREDDKSTGGKSVDSVHPLIELRAKVTNERNVETDRAEKNWKGIFIVNMDGLLLDPEDGPLRIQFAKNLRRYEARRAGRA